MQYNVEEWVGTYITKRRCGVGICILWAITIFLSPFPAIAGEDRKWSLSLQVLSREGRIDEEKEIIENLDVLEFYEILKDMDVFANYELLKGDEGSEGYQGNRR